jgi:hypothetical protein
MNALETVAHGHPSVRCITSRGEDDGYVVTIVLPDDADGDRVRAFCTHEALEAHVRPWEMTGHRLVFAEGDPRGDVSRRC